MLAEGHRGPPGRQREPELEAHALVAQALDDPRCRGMAADLADAVVQALVELRVEHQVAARLGRLHLAKDRHQLVGLGIGDALGGLGGAQAFHGRAHLGDLDRLLTREPRGHARRG